MNELNIRRKILDNARSQASEITSLSTSDLFYLLGQIYRLSCTDAEASKEASTIVNEADEWLNKFQEFALQRSLEELEFPELNATYAWLTAPQDHYAAVLSVLDRLGAILVALSLVAHGSEQYQRAEVVVQETVRRLRKAVVHAPETLLDLGMAALEQIATTGIVYGDDLVLQELDTIAQEALSSALRGNLLASRTIRVRPLAVEEAEMLGKILSTALRRSQPLEVAPDLLELASTDIWGYRSKPAYDLVLHQAVQKVQQQERVELMMGIEVTISAEEIEVEFQENQGTVLLVPLHRGEPGVPCRSRSGNHANHWVFMPAEPKEGLDGYALIVGDRLAFLRYPLVQAQPSISKD